MIAGNGLIAKKFFKNFHEKEDIVIFASGVSDSTEKRNSEFLKEKNILNLYLNNYKNAKFIYFSSIMTINDMRSEYINHKKEIESIIQEKAKSYFIIRVPQIIGYGGNKKNIINDFKYKILNNKPLEIHKDTYRAIIDLDDLYDIVLQLINEINNEIINISYIQKIYIHDLAKLMSEILNKEINLIVKEKGFSIETENSYIIDKIINSFKIDRTYYTQKCLKKYLIQ